MEYRRLGGSGLKVSALSFGAWVTFGNQIDVPEATEIMTACYDGGMNFFDNAEAYARGRAEEIMGAVFKNTGWRRDSYIVSSKVYGGAVEKPGPTQRGLSRKHIFDACHQAIERMNCEYLDLYFCHRPDREVPMEEIVRAMTDLIQQGKVMYWGTSEWSAQEIQEAHGVARQYNLVPPQMEQPEYNMFQRDRFEVEYARLYERIGYGTTIWSPLRSGILTGKYNDGIPDGSRMSLEDYQWLAKRLESEQGKSEIEKTRQLTSIANDLGVTMAQLALAWVLKNPNVSTAITGATKIKHIQDNLAALDVVPKLTDDVMQAIEDILQNKPYEVRRCSSSCAYAACKSGKSGTRLCKNVMAEGISSASFTRSLTAWPITVPSIVNSGLSTPPATYQPIFGCRTYCVRLSCVTLGIATSSVASIR